MIAGPRVYIWTHDLANIKQLQMWHKCGGGDLFLDLINLAWSTNEIGKICSTHYAKSKANAYFSSEILKLRVYFGGVVVDWRTNLRQILEKYILKMWIRFQHLIYVNIVMNFTWIRIAKSGKWLWDEIPQLYVRRNAQIPLPPKLKYSDIFMQTQTPIQRLTCEAGHWAPSGGEVTNQWSFTSIPFFTVSFYKAYKDADIWIASFSFLIQTGHFFSFYHHIVS
jgi:hypothetical protein